MRDGWMVDQDDESLFWFLLKHREDLYPPHSEMIGGRPTKADLSSFRYSSKGTECIDKVSLKWLEEREGGWQDCLNRRTATSWVWLQIYIFHSNPLPWASLVDCSIQYVLYQYTNPMTIIPTLPSLMPPSLANVSQRAQLISPNVLTLDKRMIAVMMARGRWMISPKGSRREQKQWAAQNHCRHHILVIQCIISSSDLTGSWVHGRDVCNESSLSINTVNFSIWIINHWTCVLVVTKLKIGVGEKWG